MRIYIATWIYDLRRSVLRLCPAEAPVRRITAARHKKGYAILQRWHIFFYIARKSAVFIAHSTYESAVVFAVDAKREP